MTARRSTTKNNGNGWLRDRDLIGAWAFRIMATTLLGMLLWTFREYSNKLDALESQVPDLTAKIAVLTSEMSADRAQIATVWNRMFDEAIRKNDRP
jgi:outer membrane murein-binding lipoprotein Lpp